MQARLNQIVVDCRDPQNLARFCAALLGGDPVNRARGWSHVDPPESPRLAFQPVTENKAAKNRLHLDIKVDAIEPATTQALQLGATKVGTTVTDDQGSFQVMADPEGNEFCFVCDPAP